MKPSLENLESRLAPATLTWNLNSQSKQGTLQIDLPKDSGNVLAVSGTGLNIKVENFKNNSVTDQSGTILPAPAPYNPKLNVLDLNVNSYFLDGKQVKTLPNSNINWAVDVNINGSNKNDIINIQALVGSNSIVYGLGGNDSVIGSNSVNKVDKIFGGDGNDYLVGGSGNDWLFGENGNDRLFGGIGVDRVSGGLGHDYLYDQDGDSLSGGGGGIDTVVIPSYEKTYTYYDLGDPNNKERLGKIFVTTNRSNHTFTYEGKFFNGNKNEMIKVTHKWTGLDRKPASRTYLEMIRNVPTWYI
jgi:Ca2+-binding RTX toxin-like protein